MGADRSDSLELATLGARGSILGVSQERALNSQSIVPTSLETQSACSGLIAVVASKKLSVNSSGKSTLSHLGIRNEIDESPPVPPSIRMPTIVQGFFRRRSLAPLVISSLSGVMVMLIAGC